MNTLLVWLIIGLVVGGVGGLAAAALDDDDDDDHVLSERARARAVTNHVIRNVIAARSQAQSDMVAILRYCAHRNRAGRR